MLKAGHSLGQVHCGGVIGAVPRFVFIGLNMNIDPLRAAASARPQKTLIPGSADLGSSQKRLWRAPVRPTSVRPVGTAADFAQARPHPARLAGSIAKFFFRSGYPILCSLLFVILLGESGWAQGGPPYLTNDPGTPGNLDWEINVGYIPFLYTDQSVSHTPDLDINFGVGERIQLTYENAWLRVHNPGVPTAFGLGQSNPGVKWRFYDHGEEGLNISVFPQGFLNNPNNAVRRGITPASQSFLLPVEFSRKVGPVDIDYEIGYNLAHKGPNGWLTGLVIGHDVSERFEIDMELYNQGTFHSKNQAAQNQPTIDFGARYKITPSMILLIMSGRSLEAARSNQSYYLGYFGIQFLLPSRRKSDLPPPAERQ